VDALVVRPGPPYVRLKFGDLPGKPLEVLRNVVAGHEPDLGF
jgi:hypothetical protein